MSTRVLKHAVETERSGRYGIHELPVLAFLLAWCLFVRLPFFFPATIDWDESSFILIGQGILDGFLPYDRLWETKPPLVYVFFAAAISFFGKTIAGIRLAGALWITIAAYLTYRSTYTLTLKKGASIIAGMLLITATSLFSPSVMAECLALVPLLGALLLLLTKERTLMNCLFTGVLVGMACMFRTNLAYLAVFVGIYLVLYPPFISSHESAARALLYAAGGLSVLFATAIPYLVEGMIGLWFHNVILFPIEYSRTNISITNAYDLLQKAFGGHHFHISTFIFLLALWIGGLLGIIRYAFQWQTLSPTTRQKAVVIITFAFGSGLSIFMTGPTYAHYLVQLVPFFAILSASIIPIYPISASCIVIVIIVASAFSWVVPKYAMLAERISRNATLAHGPEYAIAEYLKRENPNQKPILVLSTQIVYWFTDQYPPIKAATHPLALTRPYLVAAAEGPDVSCEEAIQTIFSKEPAFIVKKKNSWYLTEGDEDAMRLLFDRIDQDYQLVAVIEGHEIYRRR